MENRFESSGIANELLSVTGLRIIVNVNKYSQTIKKLETQILKSFIAFQ